MPSDRINLEVDEDESDEDCEVIYEISGKASGDSGNPKTHNGYNSQGDASLEIQVKKLLESIQNMSRKNIKIMRIDDKSDNTLSHVLQNNESITVEKLDHFLDVHILPRIPNPNQKKSQTKYLPFPCFITEYCPSFPKLLHVSLNCTSIMLNSIICEKLLKCLFAFYHSSFSMSNSLDEKNMNNTNQNNSKANRIESNSKNWALKRISELLGMDNYFFQQFFKNIEYALIWHGKYKDLMINLFSIFHDYVHQEFELQWCNQKHLASFNHSQCHKLVEAPIIIIKNNNHFQFIFEKFIPILLQYLVSHNINYKQYIHEELNQKMENRDLNLDKVMIFQLRKFLFTLVITCNEITGYSLHSEDATYLCNYILLPITSHHSEERKLCLFDLMSIKEKVALMETYLKELLWKQLLEYLHYFESRPFQNLWNISHPFCDFVNILQHCNDNVKAKVKDYLEQVYLSKKDERILLFYQTGLTIAAKTSDHGTNTGSTHLFRLNPRELYKSFHLNSMMQHFEDVEQLKYLKQPKKLLELVKQVNSYCQSESTIIEHRYTRHELTAYWFFIQLHPLTILQVFEILFRLSDSQQGVRRILCTFLTFSIVYGRLLGRKDLYWTFFTDELLNLIEKLVHHKSNTSDGKKQSIIEEAKNSSHLPNYVIYLTLLCWSVSLDGNTDIIMDILIGDSKDDEMEMQENNEEGEVNDDTIDEELIDFILYWLEVFCIFFAKRNKFKELRNCAKGFSHLATALEKMANEVKETKAFHHLLFDINQKYLSYSGD